MGLDGIRILLLWDSYTFEGKKKSHQTTRSLQQQTFFRTGAIPKQMSQSTQQLLDSFCFSSCKILFGWSLCRDDQFPLVLLIQQKQSICQEEPRGHLDHWKTLAFKETKNLTCRYFAVDDKQTIWPYEGILRIRVPATRNSWTSPGKKKSKLKLKPTMLGQNLSKSYQLIN